MPMKKILIFTVFFAFVSFSYGQTALEKVTKHINVSVNLPSFLKASDNETSIFVVPITETNRIPTFEQSYDLAPSYGDQSLNAYFGTLHSIIRHGDGDYVVFVYVGGGGRLLGRSNSQIYDRILCDFRFGPRWGASTKAYEAELDLMLTHYPQERAREMFNADLMVMYPVNLRGEVYEDKYSRCRAVIAAKEGVFVILYFMMPDEGLENFDDYLNDFKRAFWYNDLR